MSDAYIETLVPRSGLAAWHKYVAGESGNDVIYDYSGNARHISCSVGNEPVLTSDVVNDRPGWYFNGSRTPLKYTGAVTPKHVFIVASFDEAAFTVNRGLLSGVGASGGDILVSEASGTQWADLSLGSDFIYRKNDVVFANSSLEAPMNGAFALMEVRLAAGVALDGIQIGQQRDYDGVAHGGAAARRHKGYFIEQLIYTRELEDVEIFQIYEFFAIKFQLWKQTAAGLDVWPFSTDWNRPLAVGKRVVSSTSVSGAYKARSKGTKKIGVEPQFDSRTIEEYDTAVAFWDAKFPGTNFIYRDDSFYPSRDTEMRFISPIEQTALSFQDINYSWQAEEV